MKNISEFIQGDLPEGHDLNKKIIPDEDYEYKVKTGTGSEINDQVQSQVNIGLVGHVDHGKTTLIRALSNIKTDRFVNEQTRGITIKLGYASMNVMHCSKCGKYISLNNANKSKPKKWKRGSCPDCNVELDFQRRISFVDCPGHEMLMATMLGGAALMDAAILIIAANEKCPQPQTREHLAAIQIAGIKNVFIVQNKVDSVSKERAKEHYFEIIEFVKGTVAEGVPILPVSAIFDANTEVVLEQIERRFPTPIFKPEDELEMRIVRSFDINHPGDEISKLKGGVIGGTIISGQIRSGDEIEIRPGYRNSKNQYEPFISTVTGVTEGGRFLDVAKPGGLKGVGTLLDPFYTKSNTLVGSLIGRPGKLPENKMTIVFEFHLFKRMIGTDELGMVENIKMNEVLMLVIETATAVGQVTKIKGDMVTCELKARPICAKKGALIAINRRFKRIYRLIGWGILQ